YLNSISTSEYTLDEVLENYPASLYETGAICKEHIPLYDSLVQAVRQGVPTASADIKTMDAKGDLVWKRVRFTTLFDEENRPFWAIATAESINEYKALENQYSTVLEQNNIESWMYDLGRHMIILSNKAKGFYGLQATEIPDMPEFLIGRNLFHPEDYGKIREFYAKLHQGENFVSEIFRVREVETGDFVWRRCTYTVLPRRNGEPLYALGSSVDVTDQMESKRKYEDAMKYRYSTLEENVLLAGHCNVTRNVMLEVEDRTGLGLEHRFGRARENFYRGIASLIPNEEEKETFCKTFLNENIKKSFDLGITQHTYECAVSLGKEQNIRWLSTRI
ncbi:MAG: PAS domain-containing protein, partial [Oscillospiraceae bacterium]